MARKYRKLACLVKPETVYGTDAVPTGAADAMQIANVTVTPIAGTEESRDLLLPWLGHQGVILTGNYVQLEFDVEIAGAGAAGDVPGYGPLLRACGLSETVSAGVSVAYQPVSTGEESVSVYFNHDGVRHVALGARGNCQLRFEPRRIPRYRFTLMGLFGTVADQALPTADLAAFQTPVEANKANTTMTLHGIASTVAAAESLTIDMGVRIEPRFLIGAEKMELTDRQATGTAVVEATTLAVKDWFATALAATKGTLQLVHGTAAGNIVQIDAPKVQIGRPAQGETQRIVNYSLPLMLTHDNGDDEFVITVK